MDKKIISVVGATGSQGESVVTHLLKTADFYVRALTRTPENYIGKAHEAVKINLNDPEMLFNAFKGSYGVFVVTNSWEGRNEIDQAINAVDAAKKAGVKHYIWSTLPNVEGIKKRKYIVPPFANKSKVNEYVKIAEFQYSTFIKAPLYNQNLSGTTVLQQNKSNSVDWTLPVNTNKKVFHIRDLNDLGKVVSGCFLNPDKTLITGYLA